MSNKKSFWIPLAGSIALLLLVVLVILSASGAPSLAADSPQAPAGVEGNDSWTWRGPSHLIEAGVAPMVKSLIIDPASPYTVYVGTNQGVYRSTNDGSTWEAANGGLGGYGDLVVSAIDIDLSSAGHQKLVIGTWGYGLFQSVDGGLNWTRLADPVASLDLKLAAAPPLDAPQVRVGGPSDTNPAAGSELLKQPLPAGEVLPQRRIAGSEQMESPQGLPAELSWTPVRDVAIHPTNPSQIFACVDNDYGLFRSDTGGASWVQASGLPIESCRTFTFAPSNSQVRYASFGTWEDSYGFYRTTDGGGTWNPVGSGVIYGTVIAVAIHPTNPNIVLAGTYDDGLYRSDNGGASWTRVSDTSSLPDVDFYSVAFAPGDPNIAYAGGSWWIYRSGNAGVTWANADTDYPTFDIQGLGIHPTNSSTVLVGNNSFPFGGVYRRTSDGSAFVLAASGMSDTFVLDIEQDPNDPSVLYAATWGAGVFRSDDGGVTWNHRFGVPYIYSLEATQGPTGTILYAGTFYSDYGVLKSWDRGDHWKEVSWGWWSDISFDIKSLDGFSQNLIAATAYGVEYSTDGGETWPQAAGLNQGIVLDTAQSPINSNHLLAATYGGGVWSSWDGGASWGESSTGLGSQYVYDVAFSAAPYDIAYAATLGVYRSDNGGGSWFPSGLSGTYIRALDTLGAPGYDVFAGTHNKGVYMAPELSNWWFDLDDGLGEDRIRSLLAVDYDTLFAGTNGRGAWEYTIATRPRPRLYLPLVMKSYASPVVNHPPLATDDTGTVTQGGTLNEAPPGVLANDSDPENDPLTVSTTPVMPPTNGTLTLNSDGSYTYTHDGSETANDSFVYAVCDPGPLCDTATVNLTITPASEPETGTLSPTADTFVLSGYPDLNLDGFDDMWVGYDVDACQGGHIARSLVKFDTSPIPLGSSIVEATLSLYLYNSCDYDNRYHAVTIYRVPEYWSSSTATWNNRPSYAESYGTTSVGSRTWGRYEFDVQGLVQGWVTGAFSNYGLMIRGPESSSGGARLGFLTMEVDGTTYDPFIEVTWIAADGAQGTAVLPVVDIPEPEVKGLFARDVLPARPNTEGEGMSGYVEQTAPEY